MTGTSTSHLVNSMYALPYFGLNNVDSIKYPDQYWWSSRQRFASVDPDDFNKQLDLSLGGKLTSEYLEVDLGRVREINWLNFQVLQAPLHIFIEYDALSANDGTHNWVSVLPVQDMPFDGMIHYDANSRSGFQDAQFYFTDPLGNMVVTRFLRIRFRRRAVAWPTSHTTPFRWSVMVKELRTARYVARTMDAIGAMFDMGAGDTEIDFASLPSPSLQARPVSQKFRYPDDYARGDITPRMLGFGFVAHVAESIAGNSPTTFINDISQVSFQWKVLDASGTIVCRGVKTGVAHEGKLWVDVLFDEDQIFTPDPAALYTVSIASTNISQAPSVFVTSYSNLSPIPGGADAQQETSDSQTNTLAGQVLALRLWADVGDTGRDVLGNQYRYATFRDDAANVFDEIEVGWTSAPQPSPNAVEALYFDVRGLDKGKVVPNVIDAVRIDPRTQGLILHVYYTDQAIKLKAPKDSSHYDSLLWTPVNVTYHLQGAQTFLLPQPVRATYIKLEFSRLQPLPWRVPTHPALPPQHYRRYPTWIEQQFANSTIRKTINDWFLQQKPIIRRHILQDAADPVLAFQYKERAFLAALTTGDLSKRFANSALVDPKKRALIDPTTGSKVYFSGSQLYRGTLLANVDRESLLGQFVSDNFDINNPGTTEAGFTNRVPVTPLVSTSNDRISESFAMLSQTPMWFNRVCRHQYKIETGQFNRKAYFASIRQVQFFRKDYTVPRDDPVIVDNLVDNHNLLSNTFVQSIPSALLAAIEAAPVSTPVQVYVQYTVNDITTTDGPLTFTGASDTIALTTEGGVATNVVVTTGSNSTGTRYRQGTDFDISLSTDPVTHATVNNIHPYSLSARLVPQIAAAVQDTAIVTGVAVISGIDTFISGFVAETALVVATGSASAVEYLVSFDSATIVAVSTAHNAYAADSATVTGTGDLAGSVESYLPVGSHVFSDAATVTGVAAISATREFAIFQEAQTVTATGLPSGTSGSVFTDSAITSPPEGGVVLDIGYTLGAVNINATTSTTQYPDALGATIYVPWSFLQPTGPASLSGWDTVVNTQTIDQIIDNAALNGYQVALRIGAGPDVPSWLKTAGVLATPAQTIDLIATTNGVQREIITPVPWDPVLQAQYANLLTLLAQKLHPTAASGLTAAGTRRSNQIMYLPVTMPMVDTVTMATSYGPSVTYAGTATLTSAVNTTQTSITLTSGGSYPSTSALLRVDSELMRITAFNPATGVMTVARGYSGTVAVAHSLGAAAQYSASGLFVGSYAGVSGIYDVQAINQKAWLALGSVTANQTSLTNAWQTAINLTYANLTSLTLIPASVTYGDIFGDQFQNAIALALANSSLSCWAFLASLQPGNDGSGAVTKVNSGTAYPTYFQGYSPAAAQVAIVAENGIDSVIGFSAASIATFNTFTNPFNGAGSAFRTILEDALTSFGMTVIEITTDIVATNPGADSTANYLF